MITTLDPTVAGRRAPGPGGPRPARSRPALDPRTGAILALYSHPSYDPNPAGQSTTAPWCVRRGTPSWTRPRRSRCGPRATAELYPPGSTFKIVVADGRAGERHRPGAHVRGPAAGRAAPQDPPATIEQLRGWAVQRRRTDDPDKGAGGQLQHRVRAAGARNWADRSWHRREAFGLNAEVGFDVPASRQASVPRSWIPRSTRTERDRAARRAGHRRCRWR